MDEKWTAEDIKNSALQGWELGRVWDTRRGRTEVQIFRYIASNIFRTDEAARVYVGHQVQRGEPLATKAMRMEFHSKVGPIPKERRKA